MKYIKDLLISTSRPHYRNHIIAAAEMIIDQMDTEGKDWPEAREALSGVLRLHMGESMVQWEKVASRACEAALACLADETYQLQPE